MKSLEKLADAVLATLLAGMGIMVLTNVVLRYGFNSGIPVSEEVSRILFVWMTFLGAIMASYEGTHLCVDTFVNALPPLGRKICALLSIALMLYCNFLLLEGSWLQTIINMQNHAPITGVPLSVMYFTGVVSAIGISIFLFRDLWRLFRTGTVVRAHDDGLA
jgi:TRAP-type C4-dicarboxylate transport system permease small subunit